MGQDPLRVVTHIDLDCFYCQVETVRLSIPRDAPLAVQQWQGLIAVNYPARNAGVKRHMRVPDALAVCPNLKLVHVETISGAAGGGDDEPSRAHDRSMEKVSLERYRAASRDVFDVLHEQLPGCVIEKASIDEAYVDITGAVEREIKAREGAGGGDGTDGLDGFSWGSLIAGGGTLDPSKAFDLRLAAGAAVVCRVRGAVAKKLGYTCSAGIAHNKLLAKMASSMHKPNGQTIVPPRVVEELMAGTKIRKVPGFGGKLGEALEVGGCETAGEVAALPAERLAALVGGAERAAWVARAVRGETDDPVKEKERPKSMLAAKSFTSTSDAGELRRWMGVLVRELANRIVKDHARYGRWSRNVVLHVRSGFGKEAAELSRSAAFPRSVRPGAAEEALVPALTAATEGLLRACAQASAAGTSLPVACTRLALSTTEFAEAPVAAQSIARFFAARADAAGEGAAQGGRGGDGGGGAKEDGAGPGDTGRGGGEPGTPLEGGGAEGVVMGSANGAKEAVEVREVAAGLGVDLREQQRILADIEHRRKIEGMLTAGGAKKRGVEVGGGRGGVGGRKRGRGAGRGGRGGQLGIRGMFQAAKPD
ncbi:unnamed protein product [Pedinophyceae sp. YPF-701]|nr:unnamed protein product [Pedinophyceae sp. YPF-701]